LATIFLTPFYSFLNH